MAIQMKLCEPVAEPIMARAEAISTNRIFEIFRWMSFHRSIMRQRVSFVWFYG